MLAAMSIGVPKPALISFFATLQDVKYYTKTVYGVSERTFGGLEEGFTQKPQGTGQGNGAAPQLWAIVSTKMFEMLHKLNLANVVTMPISGREVHIVGFAYVDDSDLFAYSQEHDIDYTMKKMQTIIDTWERAAKVTGGALAPIKCWWYLSYFEWDSENNWKYGELPKNTHRKLTTIDANDKEAELQYLASDTAQEMLGVFIAPDGNNVEQVKQLKEKASRSSAMIRKSQVYEHEAWIGLTSMAMKSIEYCLPATALSKRTVTTSCGY